MSPSEAVVVRVDFGGCIVRLGDGTLREAHVPGAMRGRRKSLGNAVVVGDGVTVEASSERLVITDVAPRRNAFSRRASGRLPEEQVVAANLDQVVLVASMVDPPFRAGLADRVLGQAEHAEISGRLVINKTDLAEADDVRDVLEDYAAAGYPGHAVSALSGDGLADLRDACRDRRSLFVGHSGVGKSTVLNALFPDLELLAGQVNPKTGRGRHTTTAAWLLSPEDGIEVIDTPGVRAFGLWGIGPEDLDHAYPEFRPFLGRCRFSDCTHAHEPGCAIRAAVAAGTLHAGRHASYLKLRDELASEGA